MPGRNPSLSATYRTTALLSASAALVFALEPASAQAAHAPPSRVIAVTAAPALSSPREMAAQRTDELAAAEVGGAVTAYHAVLIWRARKRAAARAAARARAATARVTATAPAAAPVASAPVTTPVGGIWQCIADHEGSPPGNWATNTGNGFYGGLQFTEQTWLGYGGGAYARYANDATAAEQIRVGERVVAGQGWGAWPVSSVSCGVAQTTAAIQFRRLPARVRALDWALAQRGKPYEWGATGPYGFDCSGLVYAAYRHVGLWVPRTTYGMLASRRLVRVYRPRPGDFAFYGTGHVELVTRESHVTFGAAHSGAPVWWHRWAYAWGWYPTRFYRRRYAG